MRQEIFFAILLFMFTIQKQKPGKGLVAVDAPKPSLPVGWARLKVTHAGVCGTDLHIYKWDAWAAGRLRPPVIIGHEFVGELLELHPSVEASRYTIGGRYSAEGHTTCGVCVPCRTGNAHVCAETKIIGVDIHGAFAEEVVVPVANLWPILPDIASAHAAIFDPLGNAMHTCMTVSISGKKVLITGAGPIGLMCVAMAKSLGANQVTVTEVNPVRLAKATDMGADFALQPQDLKDKNFDVVLELSGHPAALRQGLEALKPTGDMVLLGIPAGEVALPLAEQVIFKGLRLHGVVGRRMYDTWYQVENFVRHHPALVDKVISHTFPAANFQQAFDLLEAGQANKIILEF